MKEFFGELKRRNVVRVAIAYAVVSWVALQLVDVLGDILTLPEWFGKAVLVLIVLGFPFALLFSWAYEITPEGVKKTEEVDKSESITHSTGRKLNKMIIGLLALAVIVLLVDKFFISENGAGGPEAGEASIAVLPFVNMSGDAANEYFSDGISEEILNVLAKTKGLQVPSRTSSFQFKGQNIDIQDIASDLGVETVLEGSIRKDGNTIRITAQLINASDGFHIWSETYDRELSSIFAIQDEISQNIATALLGRFGLEALPEDRFSNTQNAEAYNLYLRGNYLRASRREEGFLASLEAYEEALKLDPNYADAYAGLGKAYALISIFGVLERQYAWRKARESANQALALEPDNGLAYAVLGLSDMQEYNMKGARDNLARALELRPDDAEVYFWNGVYAGGTGQFHKAISFLEKGYELDPFITTQRSWLLDAIIATGQRDRARALIAEFEEKNFAQDQPRSIQLSRIMFAIWDGDIGAALAGAISKEPGLVAIYRFRIFQYFNDPRQDQAKTAVKELVEDIEVGAGKLFALGALEEFEDIHVIFSEENVSPLILQRGFMYMTSPEVDPDYKNFVVDYTPLLLLRPEIVEGYKEIGVDILKEAGLDE